MPCGLSWLIGSGISLGKGINEVAKTNRIIQDIKVKNISDYTGSYNFTE